MQIKNSSNNLGYVSIGTLDPETTITLKLLNLVKDLLAESILLPVRAQIEKMRVQCTKNSVPDLLAELLLLPVHISTSGGL